MAGAATWQVFHPIACLSKSYQTEHGNFPLLGLPPYIWLAWAGQEHIFL